MALVEFIWLPSFEASVKGLLDETQQQAMETELLENPVKGAVIRGTGGVRKMRLRLPGRGKSSGARVIYYYQQSTERIFLIAAYGKSRRADISMQEKAAIRKLIEVLKKEVE